MDEAEFRVPLDDEHTWKKIKTMMERKQGALGLIETSSFETHGSLCLHSLVFQEN